MSCSQRHADGAYVLGALSPAERTAFERHLVGCPECAAAVRELAPLPGLLGRVDPAVLEQQPPEPGRWPRLLAAAQDWRRGQVRRHRWRLAAATLAAAVAAGGAAVWTGAVPAGQQPPPVAESPPATGQAPAPVEMQAVVAVSPVVAEVRVEPTIGGSTVWMRCRYPDLGYDSPPRTFRLVAVSAGGSVEQLGSWRAGPGDEVEMVGLTRFGADLARVELQDAAGVTLLVHER